MTVEVEVEDAAWVAALADVEARVIGAAEAALQALDATGEVAVLLTDDATVRALNARFRGKDAATNVLSFPAAPAPVGMAAGDPPLGDVALAFGVCAAEARDQGKPLAAHMAHLVVHGVLHLLGWDHEADDAAEAMEQRETSIVAQLGWPDPYRALPVALHPVEPEFTGSVGD